MCGSRLFVHRSIHDEFIEGMKKMAQAMKMGPGMDPETQIGPLISKSLTEKELSGISPL